MQLLVGDNHIARLAQQHDTTLVTILADLAAEDPTQLLGTGYDAAALALLLEQVESDVNGYATDGALPGEPDDFSEDGKLLQLLDVTLADPRHTVEDGAVYHLLKRHVLVCAGSYYRLGTVGAVPRRP